MKKINNIGQMFVCKDYFLLFFDEKDQAQEYAGRYMGDDFYLTYADANYEWEDYLFNGGKSNIRIYKPGEPILFLRMENLIQNVYYQDVVVCNVILGEKIGWIPLHLGSFEKCFTRIIG